MHWSAYEIFAVISGLVLVASGLFMPRTPAKDKFWMVLGGAGLTAYGFWVAAQDSGTYAFPIWVFVFPFVLPVVFLYKMFIEDQD